MRGYLKVTLVVALVSMLLVLPALAQDGKLKIRVSPKQAYIFVDGRAMGPGNRTITLPAGSHDVGVYNYGYKPNRRSVSIETGQTTPVEVALEPVTAPVSGPWGRIQIESGEGPAAVLLNGKTPDYLVGHSDEFNNDWIWKQELIVPAGTHQITLLRDSREIWSGEVTVASNQRVIIDANKGTQRTTDWPRGQKLASLPRFKAGMASATVPVAPTKIASFAASPTPINCGDSANLSWETQDAVEARLENQPVETSGSQSVSPRGTTTYTLVAAGPGGRIEKQAGVDVNTAVSASLNANPGEVRYRRIGEKVVEQGNATLNWSTGNANSVSISPLGSVEGSGTRSVEPAPTKTTAGPVSETVTYTLTATNECGGSTTETATVRVAGSIEPPPEIALASIFFPTDYPDQQNPNLGLLSSQKRELMKMAEYLRTYLEYNSNARLLLEGNADERASASHNLSLTERRVARVKQFLVDAGIPASVIETMAFGKDQNLERNEVNALEQVNPSRPPPNRMENLYADWLAYNRRVDVVLRASIHRSQRYYPHNAPDSGILWQVPKPGRRTVEQNE